jgi:hypothetical protein
MSIKKTVVGILMASNLYAGTMGDVRSNFDVYAPNLAKSNEISGGAVFLRPAGNQDYAVLTNPFGPSAATPSWQVLDINTTFSPGFFFNLRHTFENTSNDVNLYWLHLRTSNSTANDANGGYTASPGWQMIGPDYEIGPNDKVFRLAQGSIDYSFDAINGELGQHIHVDPLLKARLFAGISGVILQNKLTGIYTGLQRDTGTGALSGFVYFPQTSIAKYNGAGLRVGLDAESNAYFNNFSILGSFASSLLIGTQYARTNFVGGSTSLEALNIQGNYQFIAKKSYANLVPAVDGKLGLKYAYQHNDKTFTVEGGYMAAIYINALVNYVPSTTVPPSAGTTTGGIYLQSLKKTTDNFSFNGPYVNASLKM